MSIVNRRNAVLGWATWKLGKRMVGRPNKSVGVGAAVLAGAASVAGALTFWRKRRSDEDS